jgi:hypothetical protein
MARALKTPESFLKNSSANMGQAEWDYLCLTLVIGALVVRWKND